MIRSRKVKPPPIKLKVYGRKGRPKTILLSKPSSSQTDVASSSSEVPPSSNVESSIPVLPAVMQEPDAIAFQPDQIESQGKLSGHLVWHSFSVL